MRIEALRPEHARDGAALAQAEGLISVDEAWLEAYLGGDCTERPELALGAWDDDRLLGISVGADFGTYAFLGPLAVESGSQGNGIGGALLGKTLEAVMHLPSIALEATDSGRRLYDRRDFIPEWETIRLLAESPTPQTTDHDVDEGDFERLASLDRECSDGDRRSALSLSKSLYELQVLSRPGAAALVGKGRLCGFVATDFDDAEAVLDAACAREATLACWARDGQPGLALLEARGFSLVEQAPRLARMYCREPEPSEAKNLVTLLSVQAG